MEELKLTPQELKEAVDFGKTIGHGFFSSVFLYKGKLIKMEDMLYKMMKDNNPKNIPQVIEKRYCFDKTDFDNLKQLEELIKKQPYIRPKVPTGRVILTGLSKDIDGVSPATIIPQHKGYKEFKEISKQDYKRLLILFRKLFDDVRQLADNEIAQEDIYNRFSFGDNFNLLYKGNDPQMIDMSGPLVKVGNDFCGPGRMYDQFGKLINYYNYENGLEPVYEESYYSHLTEEQLSEMITEFEKQTRNK